MPHLHRIVQQVQRTLARADLDVTAAEALVLASLHSRGPTSVGELVDELGHRPSTLTTILDRLYERRLVVRQVRPDDRRSFLVLLTERGQEEAIRASSAVAAAEAEALEELPDEDVAELRRILGRP